MNTLNFENEIQVLHWNKEMSGQISDGMWENTPNSDWQTWCDAEVKVDRNNLGRNFWARKDNFQLTNSMLLGIVGDRMVERARALQADYSHKDLIKDLRRMMKIMRIKREA